MVGVTNEDLYKLIQSLSTKSDEIKEEIVNIKRDLNKEIEEIHFENKKLREENQSLEKVEQETKKYSIVVYGLDEENTEVDDIKKFIDIVNNKLEINCRFDDLRDIYRFGAITQGKIRPLAVEVVRYKLKIEIQHKAKLLKGTNIYISQDYTSEEYRKQKILRQNLKKARENKHQAVIKKNILFIDGKGYTCEELIQKQQENQVEDQVSDGQTGEDESEDEGEKEAEEETDTLQGKQLNINTDNNRKRKKVGSEIELLSKRSTRQTSSKI